jgi:hypothetical protein
MVVYPGLNDRFGTLLIWRSALFVFPIAYALAQFPALVEPVDLASEKTVVFWLSIGAVILLFIISRIVITPATTYLSMIEHRTLQSEE